MHVGNYVRQGLWSFVAMCGGYYSANVVSLSFGALAINDVLAAVLTVAFCEVQSLYTSHAPSRRSYHRATGRLRPHYLTLCLLLDCDLPGVSDD